MKAITTRYRGATATPAGGDSPGTRYATGGPLASPRGVCLRGGPVLVNPVWIVRIAPDTTGGETGRT